MSLRLVSTVVALVLAALALGAAEPLAQSVKPGSKYYQNTQFGFRFKPPADYEGIPLQPGESDQGLAAKFAGRAVILNTKAGAMKADRDLVIYALVAPPAPEVKPGETVAAMKRPDITELMIRTYRGFDKTVAAKPDIDVQVKVGKLEARHRQWKLSFDNWANYLDTWTFPMESADIVLLYTTPEDSKVDKTLDVFEKSAKTFGPIGVKEEGESESTGDLYEDAFAAAAAEAASTPGGRWRAVRTPSKKYVIKTSSDNQKFVDEVIERLEKSRELYERDFPPRKAFEHVSVVRVCGNEEEFHTYGGTGGGVAGWFNPGSTELVLYDAKNTDRNMTYAVMSHEAFHQYCHFLFDQSEAHRWFDEGHGDYYGGAEFKGAKAVVTPRMPGGLDRLGEIREMISQETYKPLVKHLNFDHGQWQTQGPTNVSCYAQSWSIVYMLREGAAGRVKNKKIWKDEYKDIIPNYVNTLYEGYQAYYESVRAPVRERAAKEGREPYVDELKIPFVPQEKKKEIWKAAMDASWGKIDIDEFEQHWLAYVKDHLK